MKLNSCAIGIAYKHIKKYNYNSIFFKLVVGFICILLASSVFFTVSGSYFIGFLRESEIELNNRRLDSLSEATDDYFLRLRNSMNIFLMDDDVKSFISLYNKDRSFTVNIDTIMNKIKIFQISNYLTEGLYIYIDRIDIAVTSQGTYDLETLLEVNYATNNLNILRDRVLNKNYKFDIMPSKKIDKKESLSGGHTTKNVITVIYSLKTGSGEYMGSILINIDPESLYAYRGSSYRTEKLSYGIVDEDMKVISNTEDEASIKPEDIFDDIKIVNNELQDYYSTADGLGENYYISLRKSVPMNCYYYVMESKQNVDSRVLKTYLTYISIITLILVIAFLILFYIIVIKYKPVIELMNFCELDTNGNSVLIDSYTILKDKIKMLMAENKTLSEISANGSGVLKEVLYIRLLNNSITEDEYFKYLSDYKIKMEYRYMIVLVLHSTFKECRKLIVTSIKDTCNSANGVYQCIFDENNKDKLVLIMSLCDNNSIEYLLKDIDNLIRDNESIQVGVGDVVHDPIYIGRSFHNACYALEHRNVLDDKRIFKYSKETKKDYIYYIPADFQKKISNSLMVGDSKPVLELVDQVFDKNIKNNISYLCFVQFNTELINILGRVLQDSGLSVEEVREKLNIEFNLQPLNISESRNNIKEIYNHACEYFKETKNDSYIKEYMLDFIEKNYNKEISLDIIGEELGITANYLTRCFKKHTGMNYIDYINELRIKKAKELLLHTYMKVKDVCSSVGYQSENSFIRMFKKLEGVTPSDYKKLNKSKDE